MWQGTVEVIDGLVAALDCADKRFPSAEHVAERKTSGSSAAAWRTGCRHQQEAIDSSIFKEQLLWRGTAADWFFGGERVNVIVEVACDGLEVIRGAQQGEQLAEQHDAAVVE
jgi:hypothetical protein